MKSSITFEPQYDRVLVFRSRMTGTGLTSKVEYYTAWETRMTMRKREALEFGWRSNWLDQFISASPVYTLSLAFLWVGVPSIAVASVLYKEVFA